MTLIDLETLPETPLAPLFSQRVRTDPFPFYARLHQLGPLCRVSDHPTYDFVVHGYDLATEVLRNHAFEVMDEGRMAQPPSWETERTRAVFVNSVMFCNNPAHARLRRLFQHAFAPKRLHDLSGDIADITARLLDAMARTSAGEPVDYIASYAYLMPAAVLGRLLGVPESDLAWYRPRAAALAKVIELGGSTEENMRQADQATIELCDYFDTLVHERRRGPRDDLISHLVRAQREDPDLLSDRELLSNLIIVFNAGFVTTVHLLGNGLTLMLDQPTTLDTLVRSPERADDYVDEILRCEGPTHFVIRYAARDTSIGGVPVQQGSAVLVLLAAANRDPVRFPEPDAFNPQRENRSHLAFSAGPHYCMGAGLARVEGRIGLTMLLDRFPDIRLAQPPAPRDQLMLRGHHELWTHLT